MDVTEQAHFYLQATSPTQGHGCDSAGTLVSMRVQRRDMDVTEQAHLCLQATSPTQEHGCD
eukprot:CAMPEP_0202403264 /NCGR_PEP_ID=MMETSP1128-20130828/4821_1 /ASSEMBLY_ACC=CAM_ASM_000463 /TAXON_ID=3047 /ORGANISM="Dunaliella tertiolecta, Strain CCMP1320" /LENGTH=60 /DNA_ID=CAMNT_0049007473 /DNA_START=17 /DNA_END=196 /DNA_ORIENTATION=-